jgi:DNA-binding FrmR family transcriptional regulator
MDIPSTQDFLLDMYPIRVYFAKNKNWQCKGDSMEHKTSHKDNLNALKRINGQVTGVQRMIEDEKYCIDIVIQIHAAIHALHRVSDKIFIKHIEHCVKDTFLNKSEKKRAEKIDELIKVIKSLHKLT